MDPRSSGQSLRAAAEAASRRVARSAAARAAAEDHDGGFPAEDLADLARLGLLAAPLPRAAGGAGLGEEPGAEGLAAVLRRIGRAASPLGRLYEGHVNALRLVPLRRARASGGSRAGCPGWAPVRGLEYRAAGGRPEAAAAPAGTAEGRKSFASGAGPVNRALVTARHAARCAAADAGACRRKPARAPISRRGAPRACAPRPPARSISPAWRRPADGFRRRPGAYAAQPRLLGRRLALRRRADSAGSRRCSRRCATTSTRTGRGGDPHQAARLGRGCHGGRDRRLWVEARRRHGPQADPPAGGTVAYRQPGPARGGAGGAEALTAWRSVRSVSRLPPRPPAGAPRRATSRPICASPPPTGRWSARPRMCLAAPGADPATSGVDHAGRRLVRAAEYLPERPDPRAVLGARPGAGAGAGAASG